jgi:hypothetical protein
MWLVLWVLGAPDNLLIKKVKFNGSGFTVFNP